VQVIYDGDKEPQWLPRLQQLPFYAKFPKIKNSVFRMETVANALDQGLQNIAQGKHKVIL